MKTKTNLLQLLFAILICFLIVPLSVEGTPNNLEGKNNLIFSKGEFCTHVSSETFQISDPEKQDVKYDELYLKIEYYSEKSDLTGVCRITLNGTIETDLGTVTFDNVVIEVSLGADQDCADFAIRLLRSFQ